MPGPADQRAGRKRSRGKLCFSLLVAALNRRTVTRPLPPLGFWLPFALAATLLVAGPARADNKFLEIPSQEEARASRAFRYANLTDEQARAAIEARGIKVVPHACGSVREVLQAFIDRGTLPRRLLLPGS